MGMNQILPVLAVLLLAGVVYWLIRQNTCKKCRKIDEVLKNESISIEDQIRISKKELETVFDTITEAICIIDKDFKIVRVNRSYASMVKQPIKTILGRHCYELLWKRENVCFDCPAIKTFELREVVSRKGIRIKESDESKFFEMKTYPVTDNEGKVIHVIEFTREVTEEKRIVDQLIRSEKLESIGIMTAGVAHEMNNPLSGISGMAVNLLEMPEKYGLNDKGIERVKAILESSAKATCIMRDLLNLSQKKDNTSTLVDINSIIQNAIQLINYPGISEINQQFNFQKKLPLIHCDPDKIEQVIINIISNAVQSILEKRKILLQANRDYKGLLVISTFLQDDQNVLITISDNGIGIPDKNQSRIFDPFFSTRPAGQGAGLGLSVSHRIIEEHGGRIFFDSIDEMTVFSIVLPIERKMFLDKV